MSSNNGLSELASLPKDAFGKVKESSTVVKQQSGQATIFVARHRFAVLDELIQVRDLASSMIACPYQPLISRGQLMEVCDLFNSVVKSIKPLVQMNKIHDILSSATCHTLRHSIIEYPPKGSLRCLSNTLFIA